MAQNRKSKPAQIPHHIYAACEAEAQRRRKRTGKLVRWTNVLFAAAEKSLGCKSSN